MNRLQAAEFEADSDDVRESQHSQGKLGSRSRPCIENVSCTVANVKNFHLSGSSIDAVNNAVNAGSAPVEQLPQLPVFWRCGATSGIVLQAVNRILQPIEPVSRTFGVFRLNTFVDVR